MKLVQEKNMENSGRCRHCFMCVGVCACVCVYIHTYICTERESHSEWDKSNSIGQISYVLAHLWNLHLNDDFVLIILIMIIIMGPEVYGELSAGISWRGKG
jgi:hypothetical protein